MEQRGPFREKAVGVADVWRRGGFETQLLLSNLQFHTSQMP